MISNFEIHRMILNAYLNKITREWLDIKIENDKTVECPICTEIPKFYIKTPCDHKFCESCIKTWLNNSNTICPYCRTFV